MLPRFSISAPLISLLPLLAVPFHSILAAADDWPQFLGPSRNGACAAPELAPQWPKNGPPRVWQRKVGQGFSGPVVASGRLILFHRIGDKETVECLDALKGDALWKFDYPTAYRDDFGFDEGPRATPALAGNQVFTYGAEGALNCLDLSNGKLRWNVDTKKDFRAPKGFFGIACSPLVQGNSVFLIVGGRDGASIVAFDRNSGKLLWKTAEDEASYSSPIIAPVGDRPLGFFLTRSGLKVLDPSAGRILFDYPFRPPMHASVTAATPLIIGDRVFLSASYGTGAALLKVKPGAFEKIWSSPDSLNAHYATPVHQNGFLYGIDGRTDPGFEPPPILRCIELATGKRVWEETTIRAATLTLAGNELLILSERGELIRAPATPSGFKATGRAQILSSQVRAHPALAGGLFYARSKDLLVCVDLRAEKDSH